MLDDALGVEAERVGWGGRCSVVEWYFEEEACLFELAGEEMLFAGEELGGGDGQDGGSHADGGGGGGGCERAMVRLERAMRDAGLE